MNQFLGTEIAQEARRALNSHVAGLEPIRSAAKVASLLTCPELGPNACRLELLVQELLRHARGEGELTASGMSALFELLDAEGYSQLEDPAEDVFVSLVWDRLNNYRIFEGLYESNAFYLQRFIDAIELLPRERPFETLRRGIHGLLVLSEAIAERSRISRYAPGEELPQDTIPKAIASCLDSLAERLRFTAADLDALGISLAELRPFWTKLREWRGIHNDARSVPDPEHTPLLKHEESVYVLIPSCISSAIRHYTVAFFKRRGELDRLHAIIAQAYTSLFHEVPLLGDVRQLPTRWSKRSRLLTSDCVAEVDEGRFIHFLFVVDDFADADETGGGKPGKAMSAASNLLADRITSTARQFRDRSGFRGGVSLVVFCGWGRAAICEVPAVDDLNWDVEAVSADHLVAMSHVHEMHPLMLFRLLDHVAALKATRIELQNINGLLNLYAWAEDSGYSLVPHNQIERSMLRGPASLHLMIPQNAMFRLRCKISQNRDMHIASPPDGPPVRVERYGTHSYFAEDASEPLYGSLDDVLQGRLRVVYEGVRLHVWLTASVEPETERDHLFTLWDAFCKWLAIVVPAIEAQLDPDGHHNIHWHIGFPSYDPALAPTVDPNVTADSLASLIAVDVDPDHARVSIRVPKIVYEEFHRPENFAETAILRALIRGAATLLRISIDDSSVIESSVPSSSAKQFHVFTAQDFADYVSHKLPDKPLMLEEFDHSLSQLGLAWRVPDLGTESTIVGVDKCVGFLNSVVKSIWQDMKLDLRGHDKLEMVKALMVNIEALRKEDRVWQRTTRAVLTLHGDSDATRRRIADQAFKRNASIVSSRILLEMALCECKGSGQSRPGQLDISRLLSKVNLIIQIGGWSDGIAEGAIPAEARVSGLGIIQINYEFHDGVMTPFGYAFSQRQQSRDVREYDELFEQAAPVVSTTHLFKAEFLQAWTGEFGFEMDQARRYLDDIEEYARKADQPVVVLRRSELLALRSRELTDEVVKRVLAELTLVSRPDWDVVPDGFAMRDVEPWRYRRRLSAVSRPILQLDVGDDPLCVVAPSFMRHAFVYRLDRTYRAEFDESHFKSPAMRRWIGSRRNETGHRFNREVGAELEKHGWQCRIGITPSALGIDANGKDYGDVDVLAWHGGRRRVVAIECKDVIFAKTLGEVARQLREFRGDVDDQGNPDRLRRHLDRVNLLRGNRLVIERLTGLRDVPIESALVFRNTVPIQFAKTEGLKETHVLASSDLGTL